MNQPLVSICIPTYSRLFYLQEAVKSIKEQTYANIEICISQDITPDGLDEAIHKWCIEQTKADNRINYNSQKKNLGLAGNWNYLSQVAKGDYIIIIGDDDLLKPEFIEETVTCAILNNADVVFTDQYFINEKGDILCDYSDYMSKIYFRADMKTGILPEPVVNVFNNSIPMSAAIIKRSWLFTYRFDESANTPEFEVFLKIAIANGIFFFINQRLAFYRMHSSSATSGGLTTDRLLNNIIAITINDKYENNKRVFIEGKIIPAINQALRNNNKQLAKKLLKSKYYPPKYLEKCVQYLLCFLPNRIINKLL